METDVAISVNYQEDLDLQIRRKHAAITGVVCASLAQIGDGNIVLYLLGPSIRAELVSRFSDTFLILSRLSKMPYFKKMKETLQVVRCGSRRNYMGSLLGMKSYFSLEGIVVTRLFPALSGIPCLQQSLYLWSLMHSRQKHEIGSLTILT
jgi:hypothetical protein